MDCQAWQVLQHVMSNNQLMQQTATRRVGLKLTPSRSHCRPGSSDVCVLPAQSFKLSPNPYHCTCCTLICSTRSPSAGHFKCVQLAEHGQQTKYTHHNRKHSVRLELLRTLPASCSTPVQVDAAAQLKAGVGGLLLPQVLMISGGMKRDATQPFTPRQHLRVEPSGPGGGKPFAKFLAYEVSASPVQSSCLQHCCASCDHTCLINDS